jgi:hypothetical protein
MPEVKMNKGGRPKTHIDKKVFESLCRIHCTKNEICDVFMCDEKTITRFCKEEYGVGFSDIYKKYSAQGKSSLRRWQWKSAENGNTSMQIWLGKQELGQSDKQDIKHEGNLVIQEVKYDND